MKKYIIANWKMHGNTEFALEYKAKLLQFLAHSNVVEVIIAPPFPYLNILSANEFKLSAQDVSVNNAEKGAYTGDVSASMLKDLGCTYGIIGHSERRRYYGEKDSDIAVKLRNLAENDIIPIICIGESLDERKNGQTKQVLEHSLVEIFAGCKGIQDGTISQIKLEECCKDEGEDAYRLVHDRTRDLKKHEGLFDNEEWYMIAYEPLWAIGTGIIPTTGEIYEVCAWIQEILKKIFAENDSIDIEKNFKIVYGGSVNENNSKEILQIEGISGLLVGGASLQIENFCKILL